MKTLTQETKQQHPAEGAVVAAAACPPQNRRLLEVFAHPSSCSTGFVDQKLHSMGGGVDKSNLKFAKSAKI